MPENTSPIFDFRAGGVRHPPEADIESIRDLLRGYGSSPGILKELIQNAEDAGARRMDMLYLPADPDAPHRLLRGPSLLVINDGAFKPEHRDAITQINLGTKGTEERAIGRFGKGLKSVFAWCEAFFFVACTDPQWGWQKAKMADFFNPWHEWRHEEWEAEFQEQAEAIATRAVEHFSNIYPEDKPWLAFWFPLRQQISTVTAEEEWIQEYFPGDDPNFWQGLAKELRELAPSLVALRNLNKLALLDRNAGSGDSHVLQFPDDSHRVPAPDLAPERMTIEGVITLSSKASPELAHRFRGVAGRLLDERVMHLKSKEDWPKVVQRMNGRNRASAPVKGEPHFASLITWHPIIEKESTGSLDLRWCVFFPVGKQPTGKERITLPSLARHITINLHGFFFLDSERLRIDGLEEQFKTNGSNGSNSCIAWNHIVATQGVLANLPRALHDFAQAENLDLTQCWELAEAMLKTWEWKRFQQDICQRETWRPRWRSGVETWECLPTAKSVLPIPAPTNAEELLSCLPMLGRISEEHTLVTKADDGTMQGLHTDTCGRWPEELLLRLLKDVSLDPTADETTADWIKRFLEQLQEQQPLTPAIREQAALLPLLTIEDVRTKSRRRINVTEWESLRKNSQLFASYGSERWLGLLCEAFPNTSFHVCADSSLPGWFTGTYPPSCNETIAAAIVLSQPEIGAFNHRVKLFKAFAALTYHTQEIRLAMRYLVHGEAAHARDGETRLFTSSTMPSQRIWSRLIEQLLGNDGGANSWRLLHSEWAPILSPQIQQELAISPVDATGALNELMNGLADPSALEFASDEWTQADISALLQGLYQAGQPRRTDTLALLRRLRAHTLAGTPDQRIPVADDEGKLGENFVLNKPNFESEIPPDLNSVWQDFLTRTKIVERLPSNDLAVTVQEQIFQRVDNDGNPYSAELDWEYVVRRCLEDDEPSRWPQLILQAFAIKGSQPQALSKKLRMIEWLPLRLGGSAKPNSIVHIGGLEDDLHRLLDPARDGLASIRSLPDWLQTHRGFATLCNKYLPDVREALELMGLWLAEKPDWRLGLTVETLPSDLDAILSQLADIKNLPVASLLKKLLQVQIRGYDEGLKPLVCQHILPAVSKPFDYNEGGLERIESILLSLQRRQDRTAFDAYLSQACQDGVLETILPKLSLVNQRGQWIPARELIWPSENLNPAAQLCAEQAKILAPFHQSLFGILHQPSQHQPDLAITRGNQLNEAPNFEVEVAKLSEYLKPFRNGNVGDSLPAALIAVLGGHPKMRQLLVKMLQAGLRQQPENFLAMLLGEQSDHLAESMHRVRFLIEIVKGDVAEARTLTGENITIGLTPEIKTLHVGDPSDLWWQYSYRNRQDTACHRLRLRWVEHPDELADPVAVFASTIETILLKVHCNGVSQLVPRNLKGFLDDIADAGQSDLRRSQSYLMDMAEARLKELGVRGIPQFDEILRKFNEARQARVEAELMAGRNPSRSQQRSENAKKLIEDAREKLRHLLEDSQEGLTRLALVAAVRRKMEDFQYGVESVPLELFQNADDAVAEQREMKGTLDRQEQKFFLSLDTEKRMLEIIHWGRPINRYESANFQEGLKRGYDQDLQKMLTLNFSDKGVGPENQPAIVTGRFGLGFKSVFFVSDQPEVISGRLAFEIRGGFYPIVLSPPVAEEMRNNAHGLAGSGAVVPTAIRLKLAEETDVEELSHAIEKFTQAAPLLTVFSRDIRSLEVVRDGTAQTWESAEEKLTESGKVTIAKVGNRAFLCFQCAIPSDQRPAMVLFQLDPNGVSRLADNLTGVWITTPTAERSELRWTLNAPFKPDAGRQRLALTNLENRKIARDVARGFGEALIEHFDETAGNWNRFAEKSGLHADANFENWWRQFWDVMTKSAPVLNWKDIREGGQVLGWIAWNQSTGAMRWLIEKRAAIPSLLPSAYEARGKLEDLRFYVTGLLAKSDCFSQVAGWESVRRAFPKGQTVHENIANFLIRAGITQNLECVTLKRALTEEVGAQFQVSPPVADRIGALFSDSPSVFDANIFPNTELQNLFQWMRSLRFLARDGAYHPADELICNRAVTDLVEKDETLRATFAPDSAVLSSDYSDTALRCFLKARGQLSANTATLAEWAQCASEEEKLQAVFIYLVEGEL